MRRYLRRRAILFGTLSVHKMAEKIVSNIPKGQENRWGTSLYDRAYNYYQLVYKRCMLPTIMLLLSIVLVVLNFIFLRDYMIISAVLTILIVLFLRGGKL